MPLLEVMRLGRRPFADTYQLQRELLERRIAGEIHDTLILVEHDPIVTFGRKSPDAERARIESPEFPLPSIELERGGRATYHGPGQVVAYPIFALPEERRDLHRFLRDLEQVVIDTLGEVQVSAKRRAGWTGVWIDDRKVCSIGVAVRRWVSWHGLALNVHTELENFSTIEPCGLDASMMTRVADHAEIPPANLLFEVLLVKHFLQVFDLELPPPPQADPPSAGGFPQLPILPS